jgi:DNA-binding MarR family transcriptional regulator
VDDDQQDIKMQRLIADVYETVGVMRRGGEAIAQVAGQTQARWHVMWMAASGHLSVAMIARRLGLARQSVQRTADAIVADGLANYEPNPDHQRSPLFTLTARGREALARINDAARARNLKHADVLGDEGIMQLRELLGRLRHSLTQDPPE